MFSSQVGEIILDASIIDKDAKNIMHSHIMAYHRFLSVSYYMCSRRNDRVIAC